MPLVLMIMIPFAVIYFGLFVLAFWYPITAFSSFGSITFLFELLVWREHARNRPTFVAGRCTHRWVGGECWDREEQEVIRQYHTFLRIRAGATLIALIINSIRWLSLVTWLPLMAWQHHWIACGLVLVHLLIAGHLAMTMDPLSFLELSKNSELRREAGVIRQVGMRLAHVHNQRFGRRDNVAANDQPPPISASGGNVFGGEKDSSRRSECVNEGVGDDDFAEAEESGDPIPPEVAAAMRELEEAARGFDPVAFHLVSERVQATILAHPHEFAEIIRNGTAVRRWVWGAISNAAGDLAASGEFHLYRGVLNPMGPGEGLVRIFDSAADEMVRLKAAAPEFVVSQKANLRKHIRDVG